MLSKLTQSALFAVSQVEELQDQAILFNRPKISVSDVKLVEPNFTAPRDECCNLYADANYGGGAPVTFCLPEGGDNLFSSLDSFNDKTSSWACGKRVAYDFCNNDSCDGDNGNSGAGNAHSSQIGNDNSMSSIHLYKYDPASQAAVTAF